MKLYKKISLIWFVTVALLTAAYLFLPSKTVELSAMANNYIQVLLFFITVFIYMKEPNKKNKLIFLNFIVFFGVSFYAILHNFVGYAFLNKNHYANMYSFEFHVAAYALTLSFAIIYLVVDLLFNAIQTSVKYAVSGSIVLFFFLWHFGPIVVNPNYVYETEEELQFQTLDHYINAHKNFATASAEELASVVNVHSWKNGVEIGNLYADENLRRVEYLQPYIAGDTNYMLLIFKPLFLNMVYMDAALLFFMLLFFGYQYEKDPPQGAYIDKIMFVFLLFISTEILHYWGYMKSMEWNMYEGLFTAGQYITVALLSLMVVFFGLRLRFINSVTGEFYESELARNPQLITRWKDGIDKAVLAKFFNMKPLRLFQSATQK